MSYYLWLWRQSVRQPEVMFTLVGLWVLFTQGYFSWLIRQLLRSGETSPPAWFWRLLRWMVLIMLNLLGAYHQSFCLWSVGRGYDGHAGMLLAMGFGWGVVFVTLWIARASRVSGGEAVRLAWGMVWGIFAWFVFVVMLPAVQ